MRRALASLCLVLGVTGLAACGSGPGLPSTVTVAAAPAPAGPPFVLDGGAFVGEPVPAGTRAGWGTPALALAQAKASLGYFTLGSSGTAALLDGPTVRLMSVTIRAGLSPGGVPSYVHRLAWVVAIRPGPYDGPLPSCLQGTPGARHRAETGHLGYEVIVQDAEHGGSGIDYVERADDHCGGYVGPTASPARQLESVTWTLVTRAPATGRPRAGADGSDDSVTLGWDEPSCAQFASLGSTSDVYVLAVSEPLGPPCPGVRHERQEFLSVVRGAVPGKPGLLGQTPAGTTNGVPGP